MFTADGTGIIRIPITAPNAYAERWVSSARSECLDWLLIRSERHLVRVLAEYTEHYSHARPHRSRDFHRRARALWVLHRLRRLSASVTGTGPAA